ncbi:FGGY-family carbohydrate kinase [Brachybacterium sacelli]|uniref:Sugar (Pentulose or hexulose) kinase n=1 Tax=Brachybacterium sacelli TaxID=173364 RepID=A0ABS4WZ72_9MICO|nr:sugar (pentulose or hexulose) kinase [Brachybacterium sacelli]
MRIYAVDVGTTNLKVVLYDEELRRLAAATTPAVYDREGLRVEYDPDRLFRAIVDLIRECARGDDEASRSAQEDAVIVLTGQAESFVLNDARGSPVRPGLSWLDDRASVQAAEIAEEFGPDAAFAVTGQPFPSSTWPASKLSWLSQNEPASLGTASSVLMIKDDLVRRFTGAAQGEATTRGFTYFWNVRDKTYWAPMLDYCGISEQALPPVLPAGTDAGPIRPEVTALLPNAASYRLNVGALDHFCAMIGTGSYAPGAVSESAGTVLSLSLLDPDWTFDEKRRTSFHEGLGREDIVLFDGVDGGGAALDWFLRSGLGGMDYAALEKALAGRGDIEAHAPLFLPYLTGVNPPDYFEDAKGAFVDLVFAHDGIDMAYAVEEGVAHLLRRTLAHLGTRPIHEIVSTGGGTASAFWTQLKADVCGIDIVVPAAPEATCRGAAVLALVAAGRLDHHTDANSLNPPARRRYEASAGPVRDQRYRRFQELLGRLFPPHDTEVR